MDEFQARQEAAVVRSNTRHVSQDGLETGDWMPGDCSCEFLRTQQKLVLTVLKSTLFFKC